DIGYSVIHYLTFGLTLSKSSAEAEYRAIASVTAETVWILKFLQDLNWEHSLPAKVFCDSQAAIKIAANPGFPERTKNLEIDLHFKRFKDGRSELPKCGKLEALYKPKAGDAAFYHKNPYPFPLVIKFLRSNLCSFFCNRTFDN
nr:retrovirus-related Pol polyprotein from transposon TNT 1-94 [Tanacetum cinerariifolium]GFB31648.1 retrovirus-related Pol polyprotein from transposon TNT 1-94 [Tanacetum cinerariifolium]